MVLFSFTSPRRCKWVVIAGRDFRRIESSIMTGSNAMTGKRMFYQISSHLVPVISCLLLITIKKKQKNKAERKEPLFLLYKYVTKFGKHPFPVMALLPVMI